MSSEVAHPESIVTTQWVEENLGDANLRLVEVDVDTEAYAQGHIRRRHRLELDQPVERRAHQGHPVQRAD